MCFDVGTLRSNHHVIKSIFSIVGTTCAVINRECPIELREAISSLIFAAPRCSDLTELPEVQSLFAAKYGKEFVDAALELRPDCRVNRQVIEKLSVQAQHAEEKLRIMMEIAQENGVEWEPSSTETLFFKSSGDSLNEPNWLIDATRTLIPTDAEDKSHFTESGSPKEYSNQKCTREASSLPLSPEIKIDYEVQREDFHTKDQFAPFISSLNEKTAEPRFYSPQAASPTKMFKMEKDPRLRRSHTRSRSDGNVNYQDVIEAAQAAAECAEMAAQAARTAADLAKLRMSEDFFHPVENCEPSSATEQDAPFEMKSEEPSKDLCGPGVHGNNIDNLSKESELSGNLQDKKTHQGPDKIVSYDMFDICSENVQGRENEVSKWGSQGEIIRNEGGMIPNVSTAYSESQQKLAKGSLRNFDDETGIRSGNLWKSSEHPTDQVQKSCDSPSVDDSSHAAQSMQLQRLPSLDDDPYFSYPNLFSKPSIHS
eukprot:c23406_g1_i1 orf=179-1627(-)